MCKIPRTKLEAVARKKEINYLSAYLQAGKRAAGLTSQALGNALGITDVCARRKINQDAKNWKVGEILRWCEVLNLDPAEAMANAIRGKEKGCGQKYGGGFLL